MHFFGDYHVHTRYSDGKAEIGEVVNVASIKKLKEIGIADHGPANIGTGVKNSETYLEIKKEVKSLQSDYPDLNIKIGAEADIIGLNGELDISRKIIKELDYLLVGLHPYVFPKDISSALNFVLANQLIKVTKGFQEKVKNTNTKTLKEAIYKNNVLAITHPGLKMPVNYQELAQACVKTETAFEINTGHTFPGVKEVLEVAKSGVNFIVNSDAHYPETVGDFDYGSYVLEKAQVPWERVLNADWGNNINE